jgi:hypothetical protein
MEWDVLGRGGSGGGDPSLDANELSDALREKLRIMLRVGFAKSCCSLCCPFFDSEDALLLFCVGVVGELCPSEVGVWGSAFPVSSIKIAVGDHLDSDVETIITWCDY